MEATAWQRSFARSWMFVGWTYLVQCRPPAGFPARRLARCHRVPAREQPGV